MPHSKLKVCVVCLKAYAAYIPSYKGSMGGTQFRSSTIARHLAKDHRFDVSAMVGDQWCPVDATDVVVDDVHVVIRRCTASWIERMYHNLTIVRKTVVRTYGFPWIQIKNFQLSLLWRLPLAILFLLYQQVFPINRRPARFDKQFAKYHADVFLFFEMGTRTADAIYTCHLVGQKSILMIVHDDNLAEKFMPDIEIPKSQDYFEPDPTIKAWRQVIATADAIVAQTPWQQSALATRFNRKSQVMFNPINLVFRSESYYFDLPDRYIFWVGRSDTGKRPELCLALAKRLPHISFVMVMKKSNATIHTKILTDLPTNVQVIEQVPVDQIESIFCHATAYLSTSAGEGFPNVFLQAAKYQVPVASLTVNPNEMLTTHGGGFWANDDMDALANELTKMWTDEPYRQKLGQNALNYVKKYHDLEKNVDKLKSIILELAGAPTSEQPKP